MKYTIKSITTLLFASALGLTACKQTEFGFGDIITPSNLTVVADVIGVDANNPNGNGTGSVNIAAQAGQALSYKIDFGDGNSQMVPSGKVAYKYANPGTNEYVVSVNAIGTGGAMTTLSKKVKVFVAFEIPSNILTAMTGSGSKVWITDNEAIGHVGVGPSDGFTPSWYAADPNQRPACLYDDEITFAKTANNQITLNVDNKGQSSLIGAATSFYGVSGPDGCYDISTGGTKALTFSPATSASTSSNSTRVQFKVPGNGIVNFGTGGTSYEILALSENSMTLRSIGSDGNAWYMKLKPKSATTPVTEKKLVWSDEFNTDGAPNPAVWGYDLGNNNGWGNNEVQYYTNRADNAVVQGGVLKITAKKESYQGSNYTSARLLSLNKYSFTYGRVDIRAKLPSAGGTWPALWMLGSNIQTVGWPACGEIDIMEMVGNKPNVILGTVHHPNHSGGNADGGSTTITNASTEFHTYSLDWSASSIKFYVDDKLFYTFANNSSLPFNKDFFFIMNIALGGNLGGTIDPAFTTATMEVDYIRVYQ